MKKIAIAILLIFPACGVESSKPPPFRPKCSTTTTKSLQNAKWVCGNLGGKSKPW